MVRHLTNRIFKLLVLPLVLIMVATAIPLSDVPVEAKTKKTTKKSSKKRRSTKKRTRRRSSKRRSTRRSRSRKRSYRKKRGRRRSSRRSRSRKKRRWRKRKPRYAYPYDFFVLNAPAADRTPLPADQAGEIMRAFVHGQAGKYPANTLVKAGVFKYHALKGGIFYRREPVKYIIMHSTETGNPNMGAQRVINSWSSRGRRHPGAQFVIDRNGTIWQAVDPDLGTVHINIFKTIPGVNNDNCIGIEMVHSGSQNYPPALVTSAIRLVNYLQERYNIADENVTTHRYVQQGDHTDPVRFNWPGFIMAKNKLRLHALSKNLEEIRSSSRDWKMEKVAIPGYKHVEATILGDKEKESSEDVNLLDLPRDEIQPKTEAEKKQPEIFKEIEEPKPPTTLLQLRGPIELHPEDAKKLMPKIPIPKKENPEQQK